MTGIICLNKPAGITSFLAVKKTRWIFGEKKAGHCGTLDPMATGVLPIMLGGATRFLEFLPVTSKSYRAVMRLGITTDTLDITGKVTSEAEVHKGLSDIEALLPQFTGEIMQVPPMYSAIKKDGVRMYDLARKGIEVEREPRPVTVYELSAEHLEDDDYILHITCSSGTYVRTLIDDIGRELGTGAVMTALERTSACGFSTDKCYTFDQLEEARDNGTLQELLVPVSDALTGFDTVAVSQAQAKRFCNGGELSLSRIHSDKTDKPGIYRIFSGSEFLGLGEIRENSDALTVKRVYVSR